MLEERELSNETLSSKFGHSIRSQGASADIRG